MRWSKMNKKIFLDRVQKLAKLESPERAEDMVKAVFYALSARLTLREGEQLTAQFPAELRVLWDEVKESKVEVIKFNQSEFVSKVMGDGGLASEEEAENVIKAVFNALKSTVSEGEAKDVWSQLPKGLKELWEEA
jgi:uncharacterized protein (DUF2267 family)